MVRWLMVDDYSLEWYSWLMVNNGWRIKNNDGYNSYQ